MCRWKHGDQHATYYFRRLCVAPGRGEPPRAFRTRGFFEWFYVYDKIPPPDGVNFTLAVGVHTAITDLIQRPTLIPKHEFDIRFPTVRLERSLTHIYHGEEREWVPNPPPPHTHTFQTDADRPCLR